MNKVNAEGTKRMPEARAASMKSSLLGGPEDDPSFVLEAAAKGEVGNAGVSMRKQDWSETPETPDDVPIKDVSKVLVPMRKLMMNAMVQNRGFNNSSGLNYWNCGLNQMKGKPGFGITQLPVPQYVNPKNVGYLNMHSLAPDTYDSVCKLEVLQGMNLAGGNKPAGDKSMDHADIETNRMMPTIIHAER